MKETPDLVPGAAGTVSAGYRIGHAENADQGGVSAAAREDGRVKANGASLVAARQAAGPPPKRRRKLTDVLKAARDVGASRVKIDGYEIDLDPQGAEARVNDFDRPPNNTAIKRPRK